MADKTKARVLIGTTIAGVSLVPNDVIEVDVKTLKAHADELDASAEAIEAALESGGKEVALEKKDEPAE